MTATGPVLVALGALVAGALSLRAVYAAGRTLNDHFVAVVVAGCLAVYPALSAGAAAAGAGSAALDAALLAGVLSIHGSFHVLGRFREPGALGLLWARSSQLGLAFSLWTGLLLLLRAPLAAAAGASLLWPGRLLLVPLALSVAAVAWTFARGRRVTRHRVEGPGPFRLVHLSDLHYGPVNPRAELRPTLERAAALRPDLVAITGDLVMPFSERAHGPLLEELARLGCPVVACPGNHDLPAAEALARGLAAAGVRWLVDEAVVLDVAGLRVEVVGLTFHWRRAAGRAAEALSRLPPAPGADLRVLLVHDPRALDGVPPGRFDLALCGHTHGGQVGLEFLGVRGSAFRPFGARDQGWFPLPGGGRAFVHRGNWRTGLPPRLGIAGEIALVEVGPDGPDRDGRGAG